MRALLGTAFHYCEAIVLKSSSVPFGMPEFGSQSLVRHASMSQELYGALSVGRSHMEIL